MKVRERGAEATTTRYAGRRRAQKRTNAGRPLRRSSRAEVSGCRTCRGSAEWHSAAGKYSPARKRAPSGPHAPFRAGQSAPGAHPCGQVPPIPSRASAGHMAPGVREPCRSQQAVSARTLYACSLIPRYPYADCSSSVSTAPRPRLSATTFRAMASSSHRRRVNPRRARPPLPGRTWCCSMPTLRADGSRW